MTLKEIVGNEEMQVLLTRGQEQGFLGIEEVAEALQGMDIVQEDAEALYTHIDEMGIELLEEPEAQERRA
ncbi:MAG: RNA polymerase sigma factor region1.1 domain-containing protein, partial [Thermoleophilia bacterium]